MVSIRTFRSIPHFAELFAHVPVICWPILWWRLSSLFRWCKREGIPDVCYAVGDGGLITVRHFGAKPDPAAYTPLPRTFRPLTDASWGSALPANLETGALSAFECAALILPCAAGGRGSPHRGLTQGALPSTPNTS